MAKALALGADAVAIGHSAMMARACGKTNIHSLESEDLAALTSEASAMAQVPLAGTQYTVGQPDMNRF